MTFSATQSEHIPSNPVDPVDPVILSNSAPTTSGASAWTYIAWQGFGFSVPREWNPIDVRGNRARGAMSLGDLHSVTMQVDWRAAGRRHRADRAWKRYLKRQLGLKPGSDRLDDRPALTARLRDGGWVDVKVARLEDRGGSIHALVRSVISRRFILIRIVLGAGDDETSMVDRIFGSLRELEPGQPQSWGLYGFGFRVPERSQLNQWRMRPGHLEMTFRCRGLRIHWQRIAMARRTLGDRAVAEWLEQHLESQNRRVAWKQGPAAPRDGCALYRRPRLIGPLCPTFLRTAGRSIAWDVTDADQLVVLTVLGRQRRMDAVFATLCESWNVVSGD